MSPHCVQPSDDMFALIAVLELVLYVLGENVHYELLYTVFIFDRVDSVNRHLKSMEDNVHV